MPKVIAPNKGYSGVSATVVFHQGVGETADPYLLAWFKANGYQIEDVETVKEIKEHKAPKKGE